MAACGYPTLLRTHGCGRRTRQHASVLLRGFVDGALLSRIQDRIAGGSWRQLVHDLGEPATDLLLEDDVTVGSLLFLVQDPALRRWVESIAGCPALGSFFGRVYRMDPEAGHHDAWHDDYDEGNRMVALSVNLSPLPYQGGVLELRERGSGRMLRAVANTGPGDAVLFRIDQRFEHRVTDVVGSASKTAFAGWFQRQPDVRLGRL